jgi:hypothetical protein
MSPTPVQPTKPYKAVAGGVLTFIGLIWANVQANGGDPPSGVWQWVSIIVPALITFGVVYGITNPPKDPTAVRGQRGTTDVMFLTFAAVPLILLGGLIVLLAQKLHVWWRVRRLTRPNHAEDSGSHIAVRRNARGGYSAEVVNHAPPGSNRVPHVGGIVPADYAHGGHDGPERVHPGRFRRFW